MNNLLDSQKSGSIAIILLSHEPNDCLYQYNIAHSLHNAGWHCDLYSACDNHLEEPDEHTYTFDGVSLSLRQRAERTRELLHSKRYDIAICDTPLAVSFAHHYAQKVIYFVTEWYPSKKNLCGTFLLVRPLKFLMLVLASLLAGIRSDAFFYGELYKIKPFRFLFPWKPSLFISYYPCLDMFPIPKPKQLSSIFTFLYAGPLTEEKGWKRVKRLVITIANQQKQKRWKLLVLSNSTEQFEVPDNLTISFLPYQPYPTFCNILQSVDLCLDLRDNDCENTHCLPVKLFHYIATPTNVLYSDLKAIRKDAPEIANLMSMVQPDDLNQQIKIINNYIFSVDNTTNYRHIFERSYNWNSLENTFIEFINETL